MNDKPRTNTASRVIMQNGECFGVLHAHKLTVSEIMSLCAWIMHCFLQTGRRTMMHAVHAVEASPSARHGP